MEVYIDHSDEYTKPDDKYTKTTLRLVRMGGFIGEAAKKDMLGRLVACTKRDVFRYRMLALDPEIRDMFEGCVAEGFDEYLADDNGKTVYDYVTKYVSEQLRKKGIDEERLREKYFSEVDSDYTGKIDDN